MRFRWAVALVGMVCVLAGCSRSSSSQLSTLSPVSVRLTPSSPQTLDQGLSVAIQANISNDLTGRGVTWTLQGPGSFTLSASTATYLPPTLPMTSAQQATLTATSIADPTKSASVQITIHPRLAITTQSLPNGTVGAQYNQAVASTGGAAPLQWSIYNGRIVTGNYVGGAVPDGLTLNPTTGVISGMPTAAGTWYFECTVTDSIGSFAIASFSSLQINPASAVTANAVPSLNQPLVPAAVAPGSGGFTLHLSGTGFVSGSAVLFNSTPLATTFVDSEHLTAWVPAGSVATAGTASIGVKSPSPGGGLSQVAYLQARTPTATVSFSNAPNSPFKVTGSFGLATADFNEDGKPDLVVEGVITLSVLLSNGDGTFTPTSGSPIPIPSPPYDDFATPYAGPLAVGDFNNSGHAGVAVGMFQNLATAIFIGDGRGGLTPSSATFAFSLGTVSAVGAADFNADGNLDLSLINSLGYASPVALGYGAGAFNSAGDLFTQGFASSEAIGDFNGDGKLDVAVASGGTVEYPGSGVSISLGNGDGTFTQASGSPISFGQSMSAIVTGDFNGDGKLDLAVTDSVANTVSILLGNGDGTFQAPATMPVGAEPSAIVLGDFNGDGKLDLALTNFGDNTVTLLLGNGDGTFIPASGSPYTVGAGPAAIIAADFNGDGKLDLAVTNSRDGEGTVSILLQQ